MAVYSACVTDCGWASAGIPPLASISATCGRNTETVQASGSESPVAPTFTDTNTATATKSTATVATSTSTKSATSGLEDKDLMYGLAFRLQAALFASLVVVWIFGWL